MLVPRFARPFFANSKRAFDSLTEQEILTLAISSEEEDARIYQTYADGLREDYPASAGVFDEMAAEWFCRKLSCRLRTAVCWTHLSCERLELQKVGFSLTGELAFPDHVRGLNPGQGRLRRGKGFEALHLPSDPLDEPMILLDDIVQIFDLQNFNQPAPTT